MWPDFQKGTTSVKTFDVICENSTVKTVLYTYSCYRCITILYVCKKVFVVSVTIFFHK